MLDLLFPLRCVACDTLVSTRGFCSGCAADVVPASGGCSVCGAPTELPDVCGACLAQPPPYRRSRSAFEFGGPVQRALHRLKYGGRDGIAADLIAAVEQLPPDDVDTLIPVPLHWTRRLVRGYNQAALLATALGQRLQRPVDFGVLRRVARGSVQSRLSQPTRAVNVRGLYVARPLRGRVLLVDDVMTSGATLTECAEVLSRAGAQTVDVWSLARVL